MPDSRRLSPCLAELIFAARNLAQYQIEPARRNEDSSCSECKRPQLDTSDRDHKDGCRVDRVFRALDQLIALSSTWRESGAAVDYAEPWTHIEGQVTDARDREITDAVGCELGDVAAEIDCMRRIVACVNHCAGIPTEELEAIGAAAESWRPSTSLLVANA